MGRKRRLSPTARRIRKKRNFLTHAAITFFIILVLFTLNVLTFNSEPHFWFQFPSIPLLMILFFHYIFSIGRDHLDEVAFKWEEKQQGRKIDAYDLHEDEYYEMEYERDELELKEFTREKISTRPHQDSDLV